MNELSRAYEPAAIERRLYETWLATGAFAADPDDPAEPYCVVIPPPNVTGSLHLGHALVNTLQDVLVRRHRQLGRATLWLPGTDHAGIATQLVVERKLREEGRTREELGREGFQERVWSWKERHGSRILEQLQLLGASCDWTRTRFTLDPDLSHAVRKAFVDLHAEGLIYRAPYIVNWCPGCRTALSDLEAVHEEREGTLWRFAYPHAGGEVVVATTRPETMLGDTAVAVAPGDERHAALVGKTVRLPLVDRDIPVIVDEHVDASFGTGAVKVTPAHDPNDHEIGRRHDLPAVEVIGPDGRMTEAAGAHAGLDRFEARRRVLADLEALGLRRGEDPHRHSVARCQRCDTVVEPLVSTQWWVKTTPLAEPAIAAVEEGRIRIVPEAQKKVYLHWMRDLRDWCISRQLWWGHRIPAWHCGSCAEVTVALEDPTACGACGSSDLSQDEDVLDTWFSSALWPFSTLGWPASAAPDLRKWYPTSVLVTGHDILFFWVARMIMMGLRFMGEVPFRDVFLHGLVRDEHGDKMSKVKGNVIDPIDLVDSHGADALRFTLAVTCIPARDLPWSHQRMEGYRTFANKLWQAARFVRMHLDAADGPVDRSLDGVSLSLVDRWILSRLEVTATGVTAALAGYRFHEAADLLYHFAWDELCAWYLEMAKPALAPDGPLAGQAEARRRVLLAVLDDTLRLLHPFMPFLTEELWQHLPHEGDTIQRAAPPLGDAARVDETALREVALLQELVTAVRSLRKEIGLSEGARIPLRLLTDDADRRRSFRECIPLVQALARTGEVTFETADAPRAGCAVVDAAGVTALVPLEGLLDVDAEARRIRQQVDKATTEIDGLARRLENPQFTEKAPAEVVARARVQHGELCDRRDRLRRALAALGGQGA